MAEITRGESSDRWSDIWAAERPPGRVRISELRAEAARRRRKMALVVAGEVVLTIGLIVLTLTTLLADDPTGAAAKVWLAAAWLTWAIAAAFATWNRRGVWAPETETARSYLALSEERARRRRRAAAFVLGLTACLAVALIVADEVTVPGLIVVALYAGWAGWYGWKAHRDLDEIRRVAADFRKDEGEV